jgi:predicted enzyme related to lactoylglutathione lyase
MTDFTPQNAVVWIEIPVSDLARAKAFYGAVLEQTLLDQTEGPMPTAVFRRVGKNVAGHLYEGKPAAAGTGSVIHFASPAPLEKALARVTENGGSVVSEVIAIPDGRFAYCRDPDGNSFGLFIA